MLIYYDRKKQQAEIYLPQYEAYGGLGSWNTKLLYLRNPPFLSIMRCIKISKNCTQTDVIMQ
jgi:hypothetical protein